MMNNADSPSRHLWMMQIRDFWCNDSKCSLFIILSWFFTFLDSFLLHIFVINKLPGLLLPTVSWYHSISDQKKTPLWGFLSVVPKHMSIWFHYSITIALMKTPSLYAVSLLHSCIFCQQQYLQPGKAFPSSLCGVSIQGSDVQLVSFIAITNKSLYAWSFWSLYIWIFCQVSTAIFKANKKLFQLFAVFFWLGLRKLLLRFSSDAILPPTFEVTLFTYIFLTLIWKCYSERKILTSAFFRKMFLSCY